MADTPIKPVPESHRLDYAPPLTFVERLSRHLPSSEQFVDFLKTFVWVAPLTLLIWIYAEREQSVIMQGISVSIDVRTADSNKIVTLRRPADKNVILELSGPRAKLDQIQQLLRPRPDGKPALEIELDPQFKPGEKDLNTVAEINRLSNFMNFGITVKSAQPPQLFVDIDSYEEIVVPVLPAPEIESLLSDKPHFVPETVKLRAPKSMIENLPKQLFVYADPPNREDLKSKTGPQPIDSIPVYWVRRENVRISPPTVSATLDIKPTDATWVIPSVTIFKETPLGFEADFDVSYKATINNVEISGPRSQIELVQKNPTKYKAVLPITSFDPNGDNFRELKFDLPPGVTVIKESAKEASRYKFTKTPKAP